MDLTAKTVGRVKGGMILRIAGAAGTTSTSCHVGKSWIQLPTWQVDRMV